MSPIAVAFIVFGCVCGGAFLGMIFSAFLPEDHLSADARHVIKLGTGLIATIAALVLGLVISTAKGTYDTQDDAVKRSAAKILLLNNVLLSYGPETKEIRDLLRQSVADRLDAIWPEDRSKHGRLNAPGAELQGKEISTRIMQLSPQNETQRWLRSQALQIGVDITETRWLILGSLGSSIPTPFLVVVVFWLTIIFMSFGLFAPRNPTVLVVLLLCAMAVAGSIFLILEMDQPFDGMIKISSAPLRFALSQLGH